MAGQHDAPRFDIACAGDDIAPDLRRNNTDGGFGQCHARVFCGDDNIGAGGHTQPTGHGGAMHQKHHDLRHGANFQKHMADFRAVGDDFLIGADILKIILKALQIATGAIGLALAAHGDAANVVARRQIIKQRLQFSDQFI